MNQLSTLTPDICISYQRYQVVCMRVMINVKYILTVNDRPNRPRPSKRPWQNKHAGRLIGHLRYTFPTYQIKLRNIFSMNTRPRVYCHVLDNDNIKSENHLNNSGLHLNTEGNSILASNIIVILKC